MPDSPTHINCESYAISTLPTVISCFKCFAVSRCFLNLFHPQLLALHWLWLSVSQIQCYSELHGLGSAERNLQIPLFCRHMYSVRWLHPGSVNCSLHICSARWHSHASLFLTWILCFVECEALGLHYSISLRQIYSKARIFCSQIYIRLDVIGHFEVFLSICVCRYAAQAKCVID